MGAAAFASLWPWSHSLSEVSPLPSFRHPASGLLLRTDMFSGCLQCLVSRALLKSTLGREGFSSDLPPCG